MNLSGRVDGVAMNEDGFNDCFNTKQSESDIKQRKSLGRIKDVRKNVSGPKWGNTVYVGLSDLN